MSAGIKGYSASPINEDTSYTKNISLDPIILMVEKVDAQAIADLSSFLSSFLVKNCNPIAAEEIERKMSRKYPKDLVQEKIACDTADVARAYKEEGELPIFSFEEQIEFDSMLHGLLEDEIRSAFSLPLKMVEKGLEIQFTDLRPQGILLQILQKTGLQLPEGYFPTHYGMKLTIDQEETMERNQLVFSFQEICQKTTIQGKKFDLDLLREETEVIF